MSANDKATPSGDLPRKPRGRWLQVSLRTLLILVTLLGVGLGWFVHCGERQRRAVEALKEVGGEISYDTPGAAPAEKSFDLSGWFPRDYLDDVDRVDLSESKFTDAEMVHLRGLTGLQSIHLNGTLVTDAGLAHLKGLHRLKHLTLDGIQVTDDGLAHVQGLTQLEWLSLDATQVTDAGLAYIQDLRRLVWLDLDGTQVTDTGLPQLQGQTSLKELGLRGTQVTDAGVAKLQSVLPKCEIFD